MKRNREIKKEKSISGDPKTITKQPDQLLLPFQGRLDLHP